MKREAETRSEGHKSSSIGSGFSIDEHPLFMDRVPSVNDFRNNVMLSALAALIDEDEQNEGPGPQRRERRKVLSEPWNFANSPRGGRSSSPLYPNARDMTLSPASWRADAGCSGVGNPDYFVKEPTSEEKGVGDPTVSKSQGSVMDSNVEVAEEPACATEEQKPSSSIGELQICMRLFSMK